MHLVILLRQFQARANQINARLGGLEALRRFLLGGLQHIDHRASSAPYRLPAMCRRHGLRPRRTHPRPPKASCHRTASAPERCPSRVSSSQGRRGNFSWTSPASQVISYRRLTPAKGNYSHSGINNQGWPVCRSHARAGQPVSLGGARSAPVSPRGSPPAARTRAHPYIRDLRQSAPRRDKRCPG